MKDRDSVAERSTESIDGLRSERNFRNEDNGCLATLVNNLSQELNVDERLAAARYSVKQEHIPFVSLRHGIDGALLRRSWLESRR